MTIQRNLVILCILAVPTLLVSNSAAQKKGNKYACSEEQPEKLCNASNTCGSPSSPCNLDVKRTANSASVTPDIPNAKGNSLFCVKVGTTVNWKSTGKNIGFLIDFGPDSPFEPADAINGGYSSPASVVLCRSLRCGGYLRYVQGHQRGSYRNQLGVTLRVCPLISHETQNE